MCNTQFGLKNGLNHDVITKKGIRWTIDIQLYKNKFQPSKRLKTTTL